MNREEQFEQENSLLFLYQLMSSFRKANHQVMYHLDKRLELPRFVMKRGTSVWGSWNRGTRKLEISIDLVRNFEWEAVEYVLKHEMAHMIVSEIFKMDDVRSHGEAFKKACKVLGIDNRRCASCDFLSGFKGVGNESSVVTKVRKLMAKGQCEGATEAEAEVFMKKAQQLMSAHDLSNAEVMGTEKAFVKRPVGGMHGRFPTWLWRLGDLVCNNYGVENIRSFARDRNGKVHKYLELFGEPQKVDVAEYVFHVVMSQGESLYEKFKKNPNRSSYRKISKAAFMTGLIAGYASTLEEAKSDMAIVHTEEESALLLANDKILKEKYHRAYPDLRQVRHASPRGDGFGQGQRAGQGIKVRQGVRGGGGVRQIGG